MKRYYCIANDPDGVEVEPRSLGRVRQGRYCVPDCVDYQAKFNLPRRIKSREVFAGWSCHNCKNLQERPAPPQNIPQEPSQEVVEEAPPKAPETLDLPGVSRPPKVPKSSKAPKDPD